MKKEVAPTKSAPAAYKLTWDDGNVTLAETCEKSGRYYQVADLRASVTQHPIASIVLIEPLDAKQLAEEQARLEAARDSEMAALESATRARTEARTSVRTRARTEARTAPRQFEAITEVAASATRSDPIPATPYVAPRYGSTATGIPTYLGPRGGVYHYSKSGNKVYSRKN